MGSKDIIENPPRRLALPAILHFEISSLSGSSLLLLQQQQHVTLIFSIARPISVAMLSFQIGEPTHTHATSNKTQPKRSEVSLSPQMGLNSLRHFNGVGRSNLGRGLNRSIEPPSCPWPVSPLRNWPSHFPRPQRL